MRHLLCNSLIVQMQCDLFGLCKSLQDRFGSIADTLIQRVNASSLRGDRQAGE